MPKLAEPIIEDSIHGMAVLDIPPEGWVALSRPIKRSEGARYENGEYAGTVLERFVKAHPQGVLVRFDGERNESATLGAGATDSTPAFVRKR